MNQFNLENSMDSDNFFLINLSQIEGRIDPNAYHPDRLSAIKKLEKSDNELKKLKAVAGFRKEKVSEIPGDDTQYVGLENIESDTGEFIPTEDKESISSAVVFKKDDILFPKLRPYLNKIFLAEFDGICSTEFHVISSSIINKQFLAYFLRSHLVVIQTTKLMSGNTLPRVQTEDIYNLLIPIPSQKKQQEVVSAMQEANRSKLQKEAEAESLLNSIDDYLLSELGIKLPTKDTRLENRMFETSFQILSGKRFDPKPYDNHSQSLFNALKKAIYPIVQLKELVIHSKSGKWGKSPDSKVDKEKYQKCLVIRATEFDNLYNLKLENDRAKYRLIKKGKLKKLDIRANDLIIEKSGGSPDQPVGRIALLRNDLVENNTLCFSNFVHKIRVDERQVLPEYLFSFLKTIHKIKITEIMQSQTSGIRNLIMGEYFSQQIVVPSLPKQREIAEEIKRRRFKAQKLEKEARQEVETARQKVEAMILTEDSDINLKNGFVCD